jgi:hypothetical protein
MAIVIMGRLNIPNITCLSSDVSGGKIAGAQPGMVIYYTDTSAWKIVKSDLTLADYAIPASFSGTISLGAADVAVNAAITDGVGNYGSLLTGTGDVLSAPLVTFPMEFNGTTWDKVRGNTNSFGIAGAAVVSADITSATLVTSVPTTDQKLVITGLVVSSDTTMSILFEEETSGTDILKIFILANTTLPIVLPSKYKLATANKRLTAKGSATGNIGITVSYYSEA